MEAIRFELDVPFWCSFGDYSSLNIKSSYPFPPLTTLFGIIQNALGIPAIHCIDNKNVKKNLQNECLKNFNNLKFSIIIKDSGEFVEDYVNIHKGNRYKETPENELRNFLNNFIKEKSYKEEIKSEISDLKKFEFYKFLSSEYFNEQFSSLLNKVNNLDSDIIFEIKKFWESKIDGIKNYDINKIWISTQINRERIINPSFIVYITSDNDNEFSLSNIRDALLNPKRPLYIGESDDIVDIVNISLVNLEETISSSISSVLPGLFSNSELIKIPSHLKFDKGNEYLSLCSIPKGELDQCINCFSYKGENIVFL